MYVCSPPLAILKKQFQAIKPETAQGQLTFRREGIPAMGILCSDLAIRAMDNQLNLTIL